MISGYAEDATTSSLIYQCSFFGKLGYQTCKEAITDLALDLYAKYYDEYISIYENRYSNNVKGCCRECVIKNNEAKYCSDCGREIKDREFVYENFMFYVKELHSTTSDSYGDAEYAAGRELNWWPYWTADFIGAPKEEIIFIPENAEVVLLAALLDAKPELKIEDFNCSEWEDFKNETHLTLAPRSRIVNEGHAFTISFNFMVI